MSIIKLDSKPAADKIDYDLDFKSWLGGADNIIDINTIEDGVVVEATQIFGQVVKLWLSGGEENTMAVVKLQVTTGAGRLKELTLQLRIGSW